MKKLILALFLGVFGQAQAAYMTVADGTTDFLFQGIEWTIDYGTGLNSDISYDSVTDSVKITGSDGPDTTAQNYTQMITTSSVTTAGFVNLAWVYSTLDFSFYNDPFFFVEGPESSTTVQYMTGTSPSSLFVAVGSIFGFGISSFDSQGGAANVIISAVTDPVRPFFTGTVGRPSEVPLPPALLLFGSALAGLGFMRKKKLTPAVG